MKLYWRGAPTNISDQKMAVLERHVLYGTFMCEQTTQSLAVLILMPFNLNATSTAFTSPADIVNLSAPL